MSSHFERAPSPSILELDEMTEETQGVLGGDIGGGLGPYSYNRNPTAAQHTHIAAPPIRNSSQPRRSLSHGSSATLLSSHRDRSQRSTLTPLPMYQYDGNGSEDEEDALLSPVAKSSWAVFSLRGWLNFGTLFILLAGFLSVFVAYPIITDLQKPLPISTGFNVGGINASGQVPVIPGTWALIDPTTPSEALSRNGDDGQSYTLVFSDEFSVDGRSFYPGDDPYWEAVDLHYWSTADFEWYDPSAITTQDGKLVITMTEELINNLNWKSGMLQSWNKLCFTTGYVEVSLSLPGSGAVPGFWPGAWMMGNLGRAGYGATTDGTWPYSYDSCDLGTFPNQTNQAGEPAITKTDGVYGVQLSLLPGQRVSACTCPGSDHPGPSTSIGRAAPEIDILEGGVNVYENQGTASQSYQVAPFNDFYEFDNATTTIYNNPNTVYNGYKGGAYQQSVSAVTLISNEFYNGSDFATFGVEYWSNPAQRDEGFVTWLYNGTKTWNMPASAIGPDSVTQISERLVSEEPMSLNLNFAMSSGFQVPDLTRLQFPARMYVDYVRVYQRSSVAGGSSLSCDPPNYPTADYIQAHAPAYNNPNFTTWEQAGYTFPQNSLYEGGC